MKKIVSILIFIVILFTIGCSKNNRLKIGFSYDSSPDMLMIATKSNVVDFDTDDITLDFYFGWGGKPPAAFGLSDENYELTAFGIYFCNFEHHKDITYLETIIPDYRYIDDYYFVKEIAADDFASEDYHVKVKWLRGKKFNHYETLTVPKEVLIDSEGYFCLKIMEWHHSQKDNGYCVNEQGYIVIQYDFIDNDTVRLSKSRY